MGITVKSLTYSYGHRKILDSVSFFVQDNEIMTILGPSGVGKTTLLKLLCGMITPQEGHIDFTHGDSFQNVLLVFQDYLLFPHMTVTENIAFGLKVRHVKKQVIEARVAEMIGDFNLKGLENQYPDQLSGGQQQRVALARAIVLRPKVLLLDEPFASLDGNLRQQMYDLLNRLKQRYHLSIIVVSHDLQDAFTLSDRIMILLNAKVQQVASPQQLYNDPSSLEVAHFLGGFNFLTGRISGDEFYLQNTKMAVNNPDNVQGRAVLLVPQSIRAQVAKDGEGLPVTVERNFWQPTGQTVVLRAGNQAMRLSGLSGEEQLVVGQRCWLNLPSNHLRVFSD